MAEPTAALRTGHAGPAERPGVPSAAHRAAPSVPTSATGRTMYVVELLARSPMTAAELGRVLDMNRSTALRLLADLVGTGYVERDEETKRYRLVPSRFVSLFAQTPARRDWLQAAIPILAELRDTSGDSAILSVPVGNAMTYVAFLPTRNVLGVSEGVGATRSMHCSGQGKAYLSGLPDDKLDALLPRLTYAGGTDKAAGDPAELRSRVVQARRDGYALDMEESFDEVRCVATPLRVGGTLIGAIGVSGPTSRLTVGRMREIGAHLQQVSAQL